MWDWLRNTLVFTGVNDITVWQDIIFSSFLIPLVISLYKVITDFWEKTRPVSLLLSGFGEGKERVYVFLSQLHACRHDGEPILDQKYYILSPNPMPGVQSSKKKHLRQNIDPVWSQGDGECLADVYNVFGKNKNGENMYIADIISDWNAWDSPTISIGFNPKTEKLIEKCEPMYFKLKNAILSIPKTGMQLDSYSPNDAGIIQKTFLKDSHVPVLILAGLGTLGTSAAGYHFKKECINLGKLYGSSPFCVLFNIKVDEGRSAVYPVVMYPKPSLINIILHPILAYRKRALFS